MTDESATAEEEAVASPDGEANLIETDYTIGQDNIQPSIGPVGFDIHNPVFMISGLTIVAFVIFAIAAPEQAGTLFGWLRPTLTETFDVLFLTAGDIFVVLALVLMVSPLGKVRIGGTEATPDYSYTGWFAMLFAAGMGIGLMFFGVSEPISHYTSSLAADAGSPESWAPLAGAAGVEMEARRLSMAATIFHWGLHPWAIYAIVGLSLAIFAYNKGLPLSVRSMFYPLFGERVWGWTGHIIDILAVFATLFGLATSLGIGAQQANAGLEFLFGIPQTELSMVILIAAITCVALVSVVAGLDAGVKRLSEINMVLAALLLAFVILVGPTVAIATGFFGNLLAYAEYLPELANPFGRTDTNFSQGWTSFYWAWWISWSPFVGMFIARVSRGRTVREFIFCVLLVPSLVSVLWMTAFGGTAITMLNDGYQAIADADLELKLFVMLDALPLAAITSFIAIILVIVFFVTSSDSGSLVIDTITAGGKVNAPVPQRIFWATFEGLVAIVLLLGGGLTALQAAAVSTGLPFVFVLLLGAVALVKGLMSEPRSSQAATPAE
ncbi:BCCT family transporter [Amorphus orientalis]|uniref:BCCT family betaine/carnitine transporter n=1 Tax=Amorphus orientalis TaxID=649198 RepID=A0AAE4ARE7_9HYPH|nr:BCCT family transporter [Amorphus orientalis]MDQ0313933.1 BCCT family betaine/carnitine transporter [Amorphus orientalis]